MALGARATVKVTSGRLLVSWQADPTAWRAYLGVFRENFPTAHFNADERAWVLPHTDYQRLMVSLNASFHPGQIRVISHGQQQRQSQQHMTPARMTATTAALRDLWLQPDAPGWAANAVYRAAARHCHPDHGGSAEVMVRLNVAMRTLRAAGLAN